MAPMETDSRAYWDRKIIEWENSVRTPGRTPAVERLASRFRAPLRCRARLAMDLVAPLAPGKTVLELGCGSGFFAFELYDRARPAKVVGLDISAQAVRRAGEIAAERGISGAVTFLEGDAASADLPEADIAVGLGFLDYLSLDEIAALFARLRSPLFLFSFSERRPTLRRMLHVLYMAWERCPKHFYQTKEEIRRAAAPRFPAVRFVNDPGLSFGCLAHDFPG